MNEDWTAIMDSEVMRNYLQAELAKEAAVKPKPEIDEESVVEAFVDFEDQIKNDPKLLFAFKQYQKKIGSDSNYAKQCNPLFAQAVMMLDLDE